MANKKTVIDIGTHILWPLSSQDRVTRFATPASRNLAYRELFNSPLGKQVLGDMLLIGDNDHLLGSNAEQTAYNLGRAEMVRTIVKRIKEGSHA